MTRTRQGRAVAGPGWWRRRFAAVVMVLAGLLASGVALAGPAFAHAELASSDPANSARLDAVPDSVTLRFTESVGLELGYLRVVDGTGARVDTGQVTHPDEDPSAASVGLRAGLPDGSYIVSWRVLSADSHPVAGAYSFVVGDGPLVPVDAARPGAGASVDGAVSALFALTRWVGFAGLVLLVGGAAFLVLVWPTGRGEPRVRRLVWTGWGLTTASTALSLPLESLYASGQGLGRLLDTSLLDPTLHGNYGRMLSVRLVALAVLALLVGHVIDSPSERNDDGERSWQIDTGAMVALVVFVTYAASGHAATGIQSPLAVLSDTLHLAAMATWIGGVVMLAACLLPRGGSRELAHGLPVFSRLAVVCVATLVTTGLYQTWRQVGTLPALWSTGYGRLLLVKIVVFLVLVGLGYLSHLAVRRRYVVPVVRALAAAPGAVALVEDVPGEPPDPREEVAVRARLRRSVGLEVLIAVVVLALTAVLVNQAPARQTYSPTFGQTITLSDGGSVQVELSPVRTGSNEIHLYVYGRDGKPFDPRQVTATAALPQRELGPLPVDLRRAGVGHYLNPALALPVAGEWQIQVSVRTSEFDQSTATAKVTVK